MGMEAQKASGGDKVVVHIENNAPLGGSTQMASFTAQEVSDTEIRGGDEEWGDECVLSELHSDTPHYSDGGKSGDVTEYNIRHT